jgi:hypothetical protein
MWIKDFWDWLTTSRSYRLLLDQNTRLQNEVDSLRVDREHLLRSMSPTLRGTLRNEPRVSEVKAKPADDTKKEPSPVPLRQPAHVSWRNAKAQLEHLANSNENRKQRAIEAHAGMR